MYRTGDVGRRRRDGSIEYLYRNDSQIELRGVRIELGEIDATLLTHPAVRFAATDVRELRDASRFSCRTCCRLGTRRSIRIS